MNTVLGNEEFRAALFRLADLVAARAPVPLAILGIRRRGVPLAVRIRRHLESAGRRDIPVGELDINLYRDDVHDRGIPRIGETRIPFALEEHHILLVDDVLFTGRTVRAALTALSNFGRPRSVRLAVMVDRAGGSCPSPPTSWALRWKPVTGTWCGSGSRKRTVRTGSSCSPAGRPRRETPARDPQPHPRGSARDPG